jgi:DNA-directed RNA polymerase subunit RPC12/RpoP
MSDVVEYVCRTCGQTIPADEWDLAQHSLTHSQVLLMQERPLTTEDIPDDWS